MFSGISPALQQHRDRAVHFDAAGGHAAGIGGDLHPRPGRLAQGLAEGRVRVVIGGEVQGVFHLDHEKRRGLITLLHRPDQLVQVPGPPLRGGVGEAAAAVLLWAGLLLRDMLAQLFTAPAVLAMELVLDFERLAPLLLALLVVVGGTVLGVLYQTVRFTGLRRRLAQGELPPVQKRTYPQLRQFLLTLFLVVFLVGYFFFFNWVNSWRERPLPENPAEWDFPHITLSETVPAGTELRENARQTVTLPSQPGQIVFFYDRAYTSWLAPDQYYVTQSGLARLPGEISRQVQLVQDYTKTRAPFLAEWVYAGKVQEWRQRLNALVSEYGAEETISYPGLDQLTRFSYQYWGEDWSRACYVGRLGSQVFVLHLRGPDLETPLDLLTERLAAEAA